MSFVRIAWKNIRQRMLASTLTMLSMALGVAVMVCVIVIHAVTVRQFSQDAQGYHLIVGGNGGKLELVLSTVFHLGTPLYPIPYSYYRQFVDGEFASVTEVAVPYCLGDSFDPGGDGAGEGGRLYRVIATTRDLFDKIHYGTERNGSPKRYSFQSGQNFRTDHAFEAVLGSVVAAQTGVRVGDMINPTHGVSGEGDKHDAFRVVGILEPSGTANDRAVFVNIEGFYLLEGHALSPRERATDLPPMVLGAKTAARSGAAIGDRVSPIDAAGEASGNGKFEVAGVLNPSNTDVDELLFGPLADLTLPEAQVSSASADLTATAGVLIPNTLYDSAGKTIASLPEAQREVTSVLVLCKDSFGPLSLLNRINKGADQQAAQAVAPAGEVSKLLETIVGPVRLVLLALTILIVAVASISILVSIYNSMSERKQDIAVMRALGASRAAVMGIILSESVLLSLAGGLLGIVLGHTLIALAAPFVEAQAGVRLAFWEFDPWEIAVIPALMTLATLAGLLPAVTAYRTDVAGSLR